MLLFYFNAIRSRFSSKNELKSIKRLFHLEGEIIYVKIYTD